MAEKAPAPLDVPVSRWAGMDLMRLVAAIAIIWLHAFGPTLAVAGRFAVPFFSASIGFLVVLQGFRRPGASCVEFTQKRATRLLIPFYVWLVIYAAVRGLASGFTEHVQQPPTSLWILWNGTAQHLWFLPYAFVLSLLAFFAARGAVAAPRGFAIALTVASVACLLTPNPLPVDAAWYCPRLGFDTLSAGLAGMALGVAWSTPSLWRPRPTWAYFLVTIGCLAAIVLLGQTRSGPLENVAGFAALVASLTPTRQVWAASLTRLTVLPYGIYLSHVLFLEAIQDLLRMTGWPLGTGTELTVFALATGLSLGFCLLLTRFRAGWLAGA